MQSAICVLHRPQKIIVTEGPHQNRKTTSNIKTCAYRFANGTVLESSVHVDINVITNSCQSTMKAGLIGWIPDLLLELGNLRE